MRTQDQIEAIRRTESAPGHLSNFLTPAEIDELYQSYVDTPEDSLVRKVTGPVTRDVRLGEGIIDNVVVRLKERFGNFDVRYAQIFDVRYPHVLHNDDHLSFPQTYKAFVIPLKVFGPVTPSLVVFDQRYYGGPVKLFKGLGKELPVHYNTTLTDYSDVVGLCDKPIDDRVKAEYLTHLEPSWTEGLSVTEIFDWTPTSIIHFDSVRIHCSSDFRRVGVERKVGLGIFTINGDRKDYYV